MSSPEECPCPILCFRIDLYLHVVCQPMPRGVTGTTSKQTKGPHMAADVQVGWTPDTDPNVVSVLTTFLVNGTVAGTVAGTNSSVMAAYSAISPAAPLLTVGQVVTGFIVTTDNLGQSSPQIPFPSVTITAAPPPPAGVTNPTSKQIGTP